MNGKRRKPSFNLTSSLNLRFALGIGLMASATVLVAEGTNQPLFPYETVAETLDCKHFTEPKGEDAFVEKNTYYYQASYSYNYYLVHKVKKLVFFSEVSQPVPVVSYSYVVQSMRFSGRKMARVESAIYDLLDQQMRPWLRQQSPLRCEDTDRDWEGVSEDNT